MRAKQLEELILEPIREKDLQQVMAIETACFSSPWSRSSFLFELQSKDSCCILARLGNKVVGYGIGWFVLDELHIINIAVRSDWRRRGIGNKLLKFILSKAEAKGCRRATLELRASNEAARMLYEQHGFRPVAMRKAYYRRPLEDAVLMMMDFSPGSREYQAGLEVQDGMVSKG
jgi:ribosomal-protein-alanine N-acetyltransferase